MGIKYIHLFTLYFIHMELQQDYQQSELATTDIVDNSKDVAIDDAQEKKIHDNFVEDAAKKELVPQQLEQSRELKEMQKDIQEFIKNKFTRLDDVVWKKNKPKSLGNGPTDWWWLKLQRGDVKYTIETNVWVGHNYDLVIKDGKDTCKITLNHQDYAPEYDMKITLNNKPPAPGQTPKLATKYIGLL